MTISMDTTNVVNLDDIERLVASTAALTFVATNKREAYQWVNDTLFRLCYRRLTKSKKGVVQRYVRKVTGYSEPHAKRLIGRWLRVGRLVFKTYRRHRFPTTYTSADVALLAVVDQAHQTLSGPATTQLLKRAYERFGKVEFERLAKLSSSHLYTLRKRAGYRATVRTYEKTKPTKILIGVRRKPEPDGRPGFIRVDSVHQGDDPILGKGIYHINFVDEVTQWELVACVPHITERYLRPVFEAILVQFPFVVVNFHSDNGSEYINKIVAGILERLRIHQTKSRPRHSTDNGLVESKNGAIVRKQFGYHHIESHHAPSIHDWYRTWLNLYLNYHRPCAFPTRTVDHKGKENIIYKHGDYTTPYEKLKGLPQAAQYLRPDLTFAKLDEPAYAQSDTDFAFAMNEAKQRLFSGLKQPTKVSIN